MSEETAGRLERERRYHDHRYEEESRGAARRFYQARQPSALAFRREVKRRATDADVLELGVGTGRLARKLARRGARVTGIDISEVAVRQNRRWAARRGIPDARFELMDVEHLDLPDDAFDLVFATGVLHHADPAAVLAESARVLRPSGSALFYEPLGHNPLINWYRRRTPAMRTVDERPLLVHDVAAARDHFQDVHPTYHHLLTLLATPLRPWRAAHRAAVRVLDALDRLLFRLVPPLRRYAWVVVLDCHRPRPRA